MTLQAEKAADTHTYLVDFLRLNLNQPGNVVSLVILDRYRLEGIREHFVSGKTTLEDNHG